MNPTPKVKKKKKKSVLDLNTSVFKIFPWSTVHLSQGLCESKSQTECQPGCHRPNFLTNPMAPRKS